MAIKLIRSIHVKIALHETQILPQIKFTIQQLYV